MTASDLLRFCLLGLGPGAVYALLAIGVVVVYRGSGVVNFASSGFALVGAAVFFGLRDTAIGTVGAICVAIAVGALLGAVVQLAILRPMRRASPLARVVATLGVLAAIEQAAIQHYGAASQYVPAFLPSRGVKISSGVIIGMDRLVLLAIAVGLTAVLWAVYRFTALGIATTAVAENTRAAAALGWSPNIIATANWAMGGALGGAAGVLLAPLLGFAPGVFAVTIVPALAAAVVGQFRSFPIAVAAALAIGIMESESTLLQTKHPSAVLGVLPTYGLSDAVPFLVIILYMVVRGRALPLRGQFADRLPRLGSGIPRPRALLIAIVAVIATVFLFGTGWSSAISLSATIGFIALSVVVVTGYAGQLSLAQYSLAGLAALFSGRLADAGHLPFALSVVVGVVATVAVGLIVALPAVRVRGVNLAVITLGLGAVINSVILGNPSYTGGAIRGTRVPDPSLFGLDIQSVKHPARWAIFCIVLFVLASLMLSNIRRGRSGRRLIAIRDNERAAASLGVNVMASKLYAFAVGAGLAGVGGALLAFRNTSVDYTQYDLSQSIQVVLLAVIGSIGFILGAIVAGAGTIGGAVQYVLNQYWSSQGWLPFILAVLFLVAVVVHPDGMVERFASFLNELWGRARGKRSPRAGAVESSSAPPVLPAVRVRPMRLEVRDLGVRFSGVVALDGVSFTVEPGEVLGLIGPNGAGKTTIIDAVTGFVTAQTGEILLDGRSVAGERASTRARRGLARSFQSLELFEDLSVADNLRVATDDRRWAHWFRDLLWPRRQELSPMALAVVHEFGLDDALDKRVTELPYAQRRIVAIARAIVGLPSVVLLDEPAAGLDAASREELVALIRRVSSEWGMAVLLVEHDVEMVMMTCDRVMALHFGRELTTGSPELVRRHASVVAAYLGVSEDCDAVAATRSSDHAS
ncbi:MAG TPA: branched-chain amino acid ABC transporter permease/ATP-binding protein [Jatrophihabitantaceae bacterium]|jgi:ABC-type branched-subunit amino acid transport system ATPase component/ABC-type branched-subunit amino acid transport system permease subunit|nr:branched-chain amino acid ABC transporter permease/ATP-binding protein [Jatrophihabitantaceae bacterium]